MLPSFLPVGSPTHPGSPAAAPCSSVASVTWKGRIRVSSAGSAPNPHPEHGAGWRGCWPAHLVNAQHGAPEGAAQPAQLCPQHLQTLGPVGRSRTVKLTAKRGCHRVDDHQAGHAPRQQHRHPLPHAAQQGVLEARGGGCHCQRQRAPPILMSQVPGSLTPPPLGPSVTASGQLDSAALPGLACHPHPAEGHREI